MMENRAVWGYQPVPCSSELFIKAERHPEPGSPSGHGPGCTHAHGSLHGQGHAGRNGQSMDCPSPFSRLPVPL